MYATSISTWTDQPMLVSTEASTAFEGWSALDEGALDFTSEIPQSAENLKGRVLLWVLEHPRSDAEAVSGALGLSLADADELLEELLNQGLLDFA